MPTVIYDSFSVQKELNISDSKTKNVQKQAKTKV